MDSAMPPTAAPMEAALAGMPAAGTAYADARARLLADGWAPLPDPDARLQVIGADHARLCADVPTLAACRACDGLPELSSASCDGWRLMRFTRDQQVLHVTAFGTLGDFDVGGPDSGLVVHAWEVSASGD